MSRSLLRPQETAEDSSGGLPFLLDLYLSLSSISCSLIGQLFVGALPTPDETKMRYYYKGQFIN